MTTCLIVEDEPLAADILQDYISQIPFLSLRGICTDAMQALTIMQNESIDLLLLDIHLPGLKGMDFLKSLVSPPKVILTTAYHEYALEGYELNVLDYLLKPIDFERFLAAVNKLKMAQSQKDSITIQTEKKKVIIPLSEIVYIESQKEYLKIQTQQTAYRTKYALSKLEQELSNELFLRVHRSFVIALKKIKAFNSNEIELPDKAIPIGGNYKELVAARLKNLYG